MREVTDLKLKIWRQSGPDEVGRFETYRIDEISDEASFLKPRSTSSTSA